MREMETGSTVVSTSEKRNGFALAGLIMGLAATFSFSKSFIPVLAIILSSVGLLKLRSYRSHGKIQAWMGLVLGIFFSVLNIVTDSDLQEKQTEKIQKIVLVDQLPNEDKIQERSTISPEDMERLTNIVNEKLCVAALNNKVEEAKFFLKIGADPNTRVPSVGEPLWAVAYKKGYLEMAKLLIENNTCVNAALRNTAISLDRIKIQDDH